MATQPPSGNMTYDLGRSMLHYEGKHLTHEAIVIQRAFLDGEMTDAEFMDAVCDLLDGGKRRRRMQ